MPRRLLLVVNFGLPATSPMAHTPGAVVAGQCLHVVCSYRPIPVERLSQSEFCQSKSAAALRPPASWTSA